jgi:uncharacterized membrane protein HdeD (DUF308 family)
MAVHRRRSTVEQQAVARGPVPGGPVAGWWWFLVTGIAWLLVSLTLFRFDVTSVATLGVMIGVLFLAAGGNEFAIAAVRRDWRSFHFVLGIIFVVGGIWCFVRPVGTAVEVASVLGFLLLFKGSMDLIGSLLARQLSELWWLGAIVGSFEILLAFWASQSFIETRLALIVLWVGFSALLRGIGEIVLAFELRSAGRATAPV